MYAGITQTHKYTEKIIISGLKRDRIFKEGPKRLERNSLFFPIRMRTIHQAILTQYYDTFCLRCRGKRNIF